jgi:hypothetical protein
MIGTARGQPEHGGAWRFPRSARPIPENAKQPVYSAGADQTSVIHRATIPPKQGVGRSASARYVCKTETCWEYSMAIKYSIAARAPAIVVGTARDSASNAVSPAAMARPRRAQTALCATPSRFLVDEPTPRRPLASPPSIGSSTRRHGPSRSGGWADRRLSAGRSVDAARFETGGVRLSHLRGQVARHFHTHADLTNFGRRPYHRVVPSSGLRAPLMGHTRVNSATRSLFAAQRKMTARKPPLACAVDDPTRCRGRGLGPACSAE